MPYKFNPFTSTLDSVNKTEFTEFVYNSSGSQSKNRYNNWTDLVNEIANVEGIKKILFEQDETLPAGTYTLENCQLVGNGFPAIAGGLTITLANGFILTEVPSLVIDNFLKVKSNSSSAIMTVNSQHNLLLNNNSIISSTTKEFYDVQNGLMISIAINGGNIAGDGYEVINIATAGFLSTAFLGGGSVMANNTVRGDGGWLIYAYDVAPFSDYMAATHANYTSTRTENYQGLASYLKYDNTTSGLTADKVQSAIDELVTDKQDVLGFTPENVANKDTDGTLAANSDTKYASQKATKTYADTKIAKSQLAAKGDLISATGSSTPSTLTVGSDGLALKADSSTTTGLAWVQDYGIPLNYASGDMFLLSRSMGTGNTQGTLGSNTANANNVARYTPFFVPKTTVISDLIIYVGAANAGASAGLRLGIYNDNGSGRPGTVFVDGGSQTIAATGVKTFSFANKTLTPGYYWGVAVFQNLDTAGTNPALQLTSSGQGCQETAVASSNNYLPLFTSSSISGALANNPTITISRVISPGYPNVFAKVV